jgi:hypothetical protein
MVLACYFPVEPEKQEFIVMRQIKYRYKKIKGCPCFISNEKKWGKNQKRSEVWVIPKGQS